PAVAHTGNRLAYVSQFTDMNIWRAFLTGTPEAHPLIASTRYESDPQYSPDGRHIAFRSDRSGTGAIWVADAEGKNAYRAADFHGSTVGPPRWSPDGLTLA